jgi:hypothetical protein
VRSLNSDMSDDFDPPCEFTIPVPSQTRNLSATAGPRPQCHTRSSVAAMRQTAERVAFGVPAKIIIAQACTSTGTMPSCQLPAGSSRIVCSQPKRPHRDGPGVPSLATCSPRASAGMPDPAMPLPESRGTEAASHHGCLFASGDGE